MLCHKGFTPQIRKSRKSKGLDSIPSPGLRVLLIHALLALLEQTVGLLGLLGQVLHEDSKILIFPQGFHFALVAWQNRAQVLVCIWQQVQDVRGAVLQGQFGVLAMAHHLQKWRECGRKMRYDKRTEEKNNQAIREISCCILLQGFIYIRSRKLYNVGCFHTKNTWMCREYSVRVTTEDIENGTFEQTTTAHIGLERL